MRSPGEGSLKSGANDANGNSDHFRVFHVDRFHRRIGRLQPNPTRLGMPILQRCFALGCLSHHHLARFGIDCF